MSLVTLALAKEFLQISHAQEDLTIQMLIDSSEEFAQLITGLYFYSDTGEITELLDGGEVELWAKRLPIQSVTSVLDTDNDDAETTDIKVTRSRILDGTDGTKWGKGKQRWKVNYIAGYGLADIPAGLKHAVLDLVYRAHANRGGKRHQSAAGYGYDWESLAGSGLMKRLRRYSMKVSIG